MPFKKTIEIQYEHIDQAGQRRCNTYSVTHTFNDHDDYDDLTMRWSRDGFGYYHYEGGHEVYTLVPASRIYSISIKDVPDPGGK